MRGDSASTATTLIYRGTAKKFTDFDVVAVEITYRVAAVNSGGERSPLLSRRAALGLIPLPTCQMLAAELILLNLF